MFKDTAYRLCDPGTQAAVVYYLCQFHLPLKSAISVTVTIDTTYCYHSFLQVLPLLLAPKQALLKLPLLLPSYEQIYGHVTEEDQPLMQEKLSCDRGETGRGRFEWENS